MKRRVFYATAALLLAALPLAACGENGPTEDPDALTLMGKRSDLEKPYMTRVFDLYKKATGEGLNIISVEDDLYDTTALERFKSGDAPDLFMHFNDASLARFDVGANFYMLNDAQWVDSITESAYTYCLSHSGDLLGLPFWESSVSGCYYNKTLLEELGLGAVATQADFDGLCSTLMELGKTPICWPGNGCSWMLQFGLDPIFADDAELLQALNRNETTFSEISKVVDMVQWLADANDQGWFGDCFKIGWDEIGKELNSGAAVMTFIWDSWFYTDFTPGKYTVDDFAVMPIFFNTAPAGTYEGGNLNMMMVNKNSEKLEKALAFLDFCATPENYNFAFQGISTVSCFKGETTNIESPMVTEAKASITRKERPSTAVTKIIGYSAVDLTEIVNELFRKQIGVKECVEKLDECRIALAREQGAVGFAAP